MAQDKHRVALVTGDRTHFTYSPHTLLEPRFVRFLHDLNLLAALGIRLVLVHGARPQIEAEPGLLRVYREIEMPTSALLAGLSVAGAVFGRSRGRGAGAGTAA